jgi:hypothetical protein
MAAPRLLVIANECPLPAIHGGRIDVLRRLIALQAAGAHITLVYWHNSADSGPLSDGDAAQLRSLVETAIGIEVRGSKLDLLMRIAASPVYPSHVTARAVRPADWQAVTQALAAHPHDGILLDGLYGGLLALRLQRATGLPLYYRSHNIEHVYMRKQASKAAGWRQRLPIALNLLSLERFERRVVQASRAFFDISNEDLHWWQAQGQAHGHWMPPIMDEASVRLLSDTQGWAPTYDVGYVGNLYAPNNVEGVSWFLRTVMPLLRRQRPLLRAFIAGSKPVDELLKLARDQGVTVLANPPQMAPIIRNARVLVNPVFAGSGVNIKAVEMLFSPAALVSTPVGVGGLPPDVTQHFAQADQPEAFAQAILLQLAQVDVAAQPSTIDVATARASARARFQPASISVLLQALVKPPCA